MDVQGESESAESMQSGEDMAQERPYYFLQVSAQRRERRWSQTLLRGAKQQDKREQTQAGTRQIMIRQ